MFVSLYTDASKFGWGAHFHSSHFNSDKVVATKNSNDRQNSLEYRGNNSHEETSQNSNYDVEMTTHLRGSTPDSA